MSEIKIASRYAKSLLELAQEQDKLDKISNDIKLFVELCEQNGELVNMLKSPIIHSDKKRAIIDKAFNQSFDKLTMRFFYIVIQKGREEFLPLAAKEFVNLYNNLKGIDNAVITTAVQLDKSAYQDIIQELEKETGKKINFQINIDPSIIGGFIIRLGDRLYDASLVNKLKNIKKELVLN